MSEDGHVFFLEVDDGAVFLHIECPYEPTDEKRPCWPHLEDGTPEPPSEHAWEQCTYRDWNDNLTMVEWVHGNATVELPNAWVDWSNGDYPIVRLDR